MEQKLISVIVAGPGDGVKWGAGSDVLFSRSSPIFDHGRVAWSV